MATPHLVQLRSGLLSIAAFALSFGLGSASAEEAPAARDILKTVRVAQTAQDRVLTGNLRTGPKKIPFRLSMKDGAVRWEFQDPSQTLVLRLGENSSSLEEITADGKSKVGGARFDDPVRESDITYEDLALRFLYWSDAKVEGEQTIMLTKSWKLVVTPPSAGASTYGKVRLWIAKETGALMKADAYDRDGKIVRSFTVRSGQKTNDGLWILKQMRIETAVARPGGDRTPTYIEIDKVD